MKLASFSRMLFFGATLGVVSTLGVSAATLRHVGPMFQSYKLVNAGAHGGVRPELTCPPTYTGCASITRSTPYSATFCISTSGSCTNGLVGSWDWTAVVSKVGRGNQYKRVHASWSPDPGNPSTITITYNKKRSKGTKIIASVTLSTCEVTDGTCFSDFAVIGVTN